MSTEFRRELSRALRSLWDTPLGQDVRTALERELARYGQELKRVAEIVVKPRYKDVATRLNVSSTLKRIWGKQ